MASPGVETPFTTSRFNCFLGRSRDVSRLFLLLNPLGSPFVDISVNWAFDLPLSFEVRVIADSDKVEVEDARYGGCARKRVALWPKFQMLLVRMGFPKDEIQQGLRSEWCDWWEEMLSEEVYALYVWRAKVGRMKRL